MGQYHSPYSYVGGNPVLMVDPSGMGGEPWWAHYVPETSELDGRPGELFLPTSQLYKNRNNTYQIDGMPVDYWTYSNFAGNATPMIADVTITGNPGISGGYWDKRKGVGYYAIQIGYRDKDGNPRLTPPEWRPYETEYWVWMNMRPATTARNKEAIRYARWYYSVCGAAVGSGSQLAKNIRGRLIRSYNPNLAISSAKSLAKLSWAIGLTLYSIDMINMISEHGWDFYNSRDFWRTNTVVAGTFIGGYLGGGIVTYFGYPGVGTVAGAVVGSIGVGYFSGWVFDNYIWRP